MKFQIFGCGALTVRSRDWGVRECKISLISGVGAIVLCTSESDNAQLSPNQDEIEIRDEKFVHLIRPVVNKRVFSLVLKVQ